MKTSVHLKNIQTKYSQKTLRALARLKAKGIFSVDLAKKEGILPPQLSRLTSQGKIIRIRNGIYVHPDSKINPKDYDFSAACFYFGPKSVIGGISALFYHGLIEQVPHKIWVIVSYGQKSKNKLYRCLRTQTNPKIAIEDHGCFRITNVERTIVESLRYSSKIGSRIAIKAARTAISEGRTTEIKIGRVATQLGMRRVIEQFWDAIVL
ncbi:MAG: type IV toxin-antitoxin system AbiEi family antitoxin domain-containing protein [Deltaproteobacteria bacterium]|nr:type IV toxin-antitoxin system AbiEi family antitoxin domain-containing protein [Deltaproteobacteria bacterium]